MYRHGSQVPDGLRRGKHRPHAVSIDGRRATDALGFVFHGRHLGITCKVGWVRLGLAFFDVVSAAGAASDQVRALRLCSAVIWVFLSVVPRNYWTAEADLWYGDRWTAFWVVAMMVIGLAFGCPEAQGIIFTEADCGALARHEVPGGFMTVRR